MRSSLPERMLPKRMTVVLALAAALTVAFGSAPSRVEAQPTMPEQIDATPKGTIGLGIMGAELGFAVPALAGLHDAWAFVVFPLIGAGGGAVAGFYLIDNKDNEKAAVGVLAASMALVIPTLVLTLAMTAYDPEDEGVVRVNDDDEAEDANADEGDEAAEPQDESAEQVRMRQRVAAARAGAGLFRLSEQGLQLGVPGFEFGGMYNERELWLNGSQQRTQFQVSLFTGTF